jgi:aryl-alcohol dehydrogenase-like predicted oxidoreductase
VCTKAGSLTPGAIPPSLNQSDVVGGMHSMAPDFLSDQIDRSRANLGVDTVDVFYLHNPETQLGFVDMETFEARIRRAFDRLEELAEQEKLRWYGVATWDGLRSKGALELAKLVEIARETGGADHHFRFAQLPFNAEMVEAFVDRPESVLERAARLGVAVVASGTLKQGQVLAQMDANKAIQFTRSTPGIAVALTGMSHREHVLENLNVAKVPPIPLDEYLRFYR